jgi:hypothetical protein
MKNSRDANTASIEDYSQNRSSETPFNSNELHRNPSMSSASILNTNAKSQKI